MESDENRPTESSDKVFIIQDSLESTSADVIVCFCAPGLETGYGWFDYVREHAGDELKEVLKPINKISLGSARVTPAFGLKNFKAIVHVIVPPVFSFSENPLEAQLMKMYCKNAIDVAVEAHYSKIVFPAIINNSAIDWVATELMKCFREYAADSVYFDELQEIKILCTDDETYAQFYSAASAISKPVKIKQDLDEFEGSNVSQLNTSTKSNNSRRRSRRSDPMQPIPDADIEHMKSNGMYLVLSAKLEPTILNLKDENGLKRQYRMTNRSKDGRKLYFRCSRCDTLAKKKSKSDENSETNGEDGRPEAIRARLIICNGEVVGEEFPQHHPDCQPWTDEQLLVQQIDRSSRKTVKEGLLQPFEAYQDALSRITSVTNQTEAKIIDVPSFPGWSHGRQKFKKRKHEIEEESEMYEEVTYMESSAEQEQVYQEEQVPSPTDPQSAATGDISVTD